MPKGPLFKAVKEGNLEEVRRLLASGIKPDDERSWYDQTPLTTAAVDGHTDVIIELVKAKADINAKDKANVTPLMVAGFNGHTDVVIELVKAKAEINHLDHHNYTPLMMTAVKGHTDVVVELVKAKANIKDERGKNAMSCATLNGHSKTVSVIEQARDDFEGFLKYHMTKEEKNNACRREYGRAFALASRVIKLSNPENITMSDVQKRLPHVYRDLIRFFSRNPGLVKWTGTTLLLYFNAGSPDVLGSEDSE